MRYEWLILIGIGIITLVLFVWWLPKWQVKKIVVFGSKTKWEAENEFRKTLIQIIGGLVFISGLLFTWMQMIDSRKQFQDSQTTLKAGQLSSRFSQAVTLLSKEGPTNRIGAIYALEQIARESPNYLQTVLDILTSFVKNSQYFENNIIEDKDRENTKNDLVQKLKSIKSNSWKEISEILKDYKVLPEVAVALKVIGRIRKNVIKIMHPELFQDKGEIEFYPYDHLNISRPETIDRKSQLYKKIASYQIDFRNAFLINSDLRTANLQGVDLRGADLRGAILRQAMLSHSTLQGAKLQGADLIGATLKGGNLLLADLQEAKIWNADLREADLQGAKLQWAELEGSILKEAKLQWANFQEADLHGANLQGAKLQEANLQGAKLQGVDLRRANLLHAIGLTVEMLSEVKSLNQVQGLDKKMREILKKNHPELFEPLE